jgi:drug/metabolite transporter (DMT)-like permease
MNSGYLIAFAAMTCYALLPPMAKALTTSGFSGPHLILINSVVLTVLSVIYLAFSHYDFNVLYQVKTSTWMLALFWGSVNFLGFILYLIAISKIPATDYQIMYLASPLIVALVSYFFLNETLHFKHLIGGGLVVLGVYIVVKH